MLRKGGVRRLEGGSVGDLVSGDAAGAAQEGGCGVPAIPASLMFVRKFSGLCCVSVHRR